MLLCAAGFCLCNTLLLVGKNVDSATLEQSGAREQDYSVHYPVSLLAARVNRFMGFINGHCFFTRGYLLLSLGFVLSGLAVLVQGGPLQGFGIMAAPLLLVLAVNGLYLLFAILTVSLCGRRAETRLGMLYLPMLFLVPMACLSMLVDTALLASLPPLSAAMWLTGLFVLLFVGLMLVFSGCDEALIRHINRVAAGFYLLLLLGWMEAFHDYPQTWVMPLQVTECERPTGVCKVTFELNGQQHRLYLATAGQTPGQGAADLQQQVVIRHGLFNHYGLR